jgi:N-acetyl-gamma-glutamyl-phosphate reductase
MELARILSRHPGFNIEFVTTDKWAGKKLGTRLALPAGAAGLTCLSQEQGRAAFGSVEVLFLCTPNEVSIDLAPRALEAGTRVVDLSGGFRLAAELYPEWYGFSHGQPSLLPEAVYSMPEATGNVERLRHAKLVANPGCYATAATLAVLPLLREELIEPVGLVIDAKSGTTGGGRKASEEWSFSEVDGDTRAYRVLNHQHTPEIERALELSGVPGASLVFTPHLLPTRRGILATAYGRLTDAAATGDVQAVVQRALESFAEGRPFIRVVGGPEEVTLHASVGTNRVVLGARAEVRRQVVVICASLDNLVKGAAGQAVQNANLMFGLSELAGLADLVGHSP